MHASSQLNGKDEGDSPPPPLSVAFVHLAVSAMNGCNFGRHQPVAVASVSAPSSGQGLGVGTVSQGLIQST